MPRPPDDESGNPELLEVLRRMIDAHGPVTFKWFMEQALYHPDHGYYSSGKARVGKRGDFFTNVSVGKIFGELMAAQFEEMWRRMGKPMAFAIMEQGANDGQFCADVLGWLREHAPRLYEVLTYWIVEPSERLHEVQRARLSGWPRAKVRWISKLEEFEVGTLCGVHFSNELVDAFPVHLIVHDGVDWSEVFVDGTMKGGFRQIHGPLSNARLREFVRRLPTPPRDCLPYRTEVNLRAQTWMEDVGRILRFGYILTVDYGYPREDYYASGRLSGTLAAYHQHQRLPDPLQRLGEADLTAHVEFTTLAEVAEEHGLRLAGYCDQHHFLVGMGEDLLMDLEYRARGAGGVVDEEMAQAIRQFRTLMHPSAMGMAFKYLCFSKGSTLPGELLSGFRHGGDPRAKLGLPPPRSRSSDYDPL